MVDAKMLSRIEHAPGFIAALDQSGGSTPRALEIYGIGRSCYQDEATMYALIHQMRIRIMTAPSFACGKIIAAILFEKTIDGLIDGKSVPSFLRERDIVPFLKIDKGLEEQADGVQRMRHIPNLDDLLRRVRTAGMVGTKMRSLVHAPSLSGIKSLVEQQFALASRIMEHDLLPIIEPEVHLEGAQRERCEGILADELSASLDTVPSDRKVILKLSLPVRPNGYAKLVGHPRIARVAALSGGYTRNQACAELAKNQGMIASFSRALLQDLRATMKPHEFDRALGRAIEQIYQASTHKV